MEIGPGLEIGDDEIEERFVRSSGPGGQNVNKVATAVELRFDASRSAAIDADMLPRIRKLAGSRMTSEGVVVIQARRFRTQAQNRADARARLAELLRRAAVPERRRRRTAPSRASRERRIEMKRQRAETKQRRARITPDE